ncbi:MAG: hypothetical protein K6A23_10885 [Butyrivibrio sp.]|nr:hypothetical protein [Butyrivibrio sp.]
MAESGDGLAAGNSQIVVSDHLTIIKGDGNKCFFIEFVTGRKCERLAIGDGKLSISKKSILPVDTHYKVLLPKGYIVNGKDTVDIIMNEDSEDLEVEVYCV